MHLQRFFKVSEDEVRLAHLAVDVGQDFRVVRSSLKENLVWSTYYCYRP